MAPSVIAPSVMAPSVMAPSVIAPSVTSPSVIAPLVDHVADLGDVVGVLATQAVVRVLPRKRVPLAPFSAGHVLERVVTEGVVASNVVVAGERRRHRSVQSPNSQLP